MAGKSKLLNESSVFTLAMALGLAWVLGGTAPSNAAIVQKIDVRGNSRIDPEVVRDNLGIAPGQDINNSDIDYATKHLFGLGLFSDVSIHQAGSSLIVQVKEYEVVNKVIFKGNKKIKDADFMRFLSLKPRGGYDSVKLAADKEMIRDAYNSVGLYDVIINSEIVDLGQGRINVVFTIDEGKRSKIADITFEGNHVFGERRLRDVLVTKRSNIFSWLTRGDIYSEDRLAADEEVLRRFYHSRGYADFRVVSSIADLDPATNKYSIKFVIDEGQPYRLGRVSVESNVASIDSASLESLVKTHSGDIYNITNIERSVIALGDKVADSGYAFARVEPLIDRDFSSRTISVTYTIAEGARAYVERIEIRGNNKTHDYVIRREFDLSEGDAFNQTILRRAKQRLDRLGFFQNVNISTSSGSGPDQIVLVVDVVEKSTGTFSLGGGYTSGGESPGAFVEASVVEENFLGRGQYVRLGAGLGQSDSRNYNFSFTDPYFLGYRVSAGFDVFQRSYRMNKDYDVKQVGGSLRLGLPITDYLVGGLAYNYVEENYELDGLSKKGSLDSLSPVEIVSLYDKYSGAIIEAANKSPWRRSSVSYSLSYNSIDDVNNPHDGLSTQFVQEYAGLGGDAKFFKTTGKATLYKTLSEKHDLVTLVSGGGGYLHGIGNDGLRVFDMFKNGSDMIRGFRYNGIGPYQLSNNNNRYFLGGKTYFNATAELQFPLPLVPDALGMRGAFFADAATLFGSDYKLSTIEKLTGRDVLNTASSWRASAGMSLMWASPFGPLRFDYAWPLKKETGDVVQKFNFGIATKF